MPETAASADASESSRDDQWTFRTRELDVAVNFLARTIRIVARQGTVTDRRASSPSREPVHGRVDVSFDLLGMSITASPLTKDKGSAIHSPTIGTAVVGGQVVTVTGTTVTGWSSREVRTGRTLLTLTSTPWKKHVHTEVSVSSPLRPDGKLNKHGRVATKWSFQAGIVVQLKLDDDVGERFAVEWKTDVAPKIVAAGKAEDDRLITERLVDEERLLTEFKANAHADRARTESVEAESSEPRRSAAQDPAV